MRQASLAFACALLAAPPAAAQSLGPEPCHRPPKPWVPPGAHAEEWQFDQAGYDLDLYLADVEAYLVCLGTETKNIKAEREAVRREWKAQWEDFQRRKP